MLQNTHGLLLLDVCGTVLDADEAACKLYGLRRPRKEGDEQCRHDDDDGDDADGPKQLPLVCSELIIPEPYASQHRYFTYPNVPKLSDNVVLTKVGEGFMADGSRRGLFVTMVKLPSSITPAPSGNPQQLLSTVHVMDTSYASLTVMGCPPVISSCSLSAARIFGLSSRTLCGKPASCFIRALKGLSVPEKRVALLSGRPQNCVVTTAEGKRIPVSMIAHLCTKGTFGIKFGTVYIHPIEPFYEVTLMCNPAGIVEHVSHTWLHFVFGMKATDVVGKPLCTLFEDSPCPPEDAALWLDYLHGLATGSDGDTGMRLNAIHSDGTLMPTYVRARSFETMTGETRYLFVIRRIDMGDFMGKGLNDVDWNFMTAVSRHTCDKAAASPQKGAHTEASSSHCNDDGEQESPPPAQASPAHVAPARNRLSTCHRQLQSHDSQVTLRPLGLYELLSVATIGPYRMGEMLGKGSFGVVRLGHHKETGDRVAVKMIPKHALSPEAVDRCVRGAHIVKALSHDNVVKCFDILQCQQIMYLVLEYVEGGDLHTYITQNGALSEARAQRVFRQLVGAVHYCHEHNVIHRDIKTANILLNSAGDPTLCKLADFGLSNFTMPADVHSTFCGTPAYAPPEMLLGIKYTGPAVDVWSLGVVLYVMLMGQQPFVDVHALIEGIFEPPTHISDACRAVLFACLHVTPGSRPTTAALLDMAWLQESDTALSRSSSPAKGPLEPLTMAGKASDDSIAGEHHSSSSGSLTSNGSETLTSESAVLLQQKQDRRRRQGKATGQRKRGSLSDDEGMEAWDATAVKGSQPPVPSKRQRGSTSTSSS